MKRWFALIVAVLLPLQMAWGMAAAYCQHEANIDASRHFGHHSHVHQDGLKDAQDLSSKLQLDADCGFCHSSPPATFRAPATPPLSGAAGTHRPDARAQGFPSAPTRAPDRPQWLRLA